MLFSLPLLLTMASADDGLHLLQTHAHVRSTAAEVKSHNHVSAKWVPGSGTVANKCGKGGDLTGDLAGWTGGDTYNVGSLKIDNAATKELCIENVLKDPRCQNKKAEIDAKRKENPSYAYSLAASYAPGQAKCFCSWGTVETQKDPSGNPMASGWITCIAALEKTPKPLKPIPANAKTPIYELKKRHPKFGPDGTWATPYCKSLLGCTPYCPDGCDGVAYWEASRAPPGLGAEGREEYNANHPGAHFLSCIPGDKTRGRPPTPDYNIKTMGGNIQCSGSENSTKTPFWHKSIMTTAQKDELKITWGVNDDGVAKSWNSGGAWGDGHGWGNEYCPKGCVNDCAEFKMGGFLSCGYTPHAGSSGWTGYNGQRSNAAGPNYYCPQGVVSGTGVQAWTWCGEPAKTKEEKEAARAEKENFSCDLCEHSENEFNPKGKRGKCQRIHDRAQKNAKRCEKRQGRVGVIRGCCPNPPVECSICPDGSTFNGDNLDGKCAKIATRSTKNEELCDKIKGRKRVQKKCCDKGEEEKEGPAKTYTPDDFALTKGNECAEGSKPVDYKTCHDEAANYQWPGQKAGHTQRWDEEDHDPEFGAGWTFMPPGCVLYIGWRGDSHEAQVRWNPNQNGKNDGNRALVCEKGSEEPSTAAATTTQAPNLLETKCHCNLAADQDIDNVYIDGVDKTDSLEGTGPDDIYLSFPKMNKILRFQCTAATKIAIKASDGNLNAYTVGGCKSGGFALKCVTDDQSSVWHQYRTDLSWKAKAFNCPLNSHQKSECKVFNVPGSHKNTFIPTPPSNWFANDFDDSEWENAKEGIPHTVSALVGSDISICAEGGAGWLFRGGSTQCHAESLSSCTVTSD